MLEEVPIRKLKEEIKRREKASKNDPEWVRRPFWWQCFNIWSCFTSGICLTLLFPIWAPFYFATKTYKWGLKEARKRAREEGWDWAKYHPEDTKYTK